MTLEMFVACENGLLREKHTKNPQEGRVITESYVQKPTSPVDLVFAIIVAKQLAIMQNLTLPGIAFKYIFLSWNRPPIDTSLVQQRFQHSVNVEQLVDAQMAT